MAGVQITRSSNTVTDVIDNVTLTLKEVTAAAVTVEVTSDPSANLAEIQSFVTALNDTRQFVKDQTTFTEDAAAQTGLAGVDQAEEQSNVRQNRSI